MQQCGAWCGATAVSLPLSYLTLRATVLKVPITEKGKKVVLKLVYILLCTVGDTNLFLQLYIV